MRCCVLPCVLMLALTTMATSAAQAPADIQDLMARIGARVAEFYVQARNVICLEVSTVQPIDITQSPVGFSRTVEAELRVEGESDQGSDEPTIVRTIRKVNGRPPRERDGKDRSGCTDPNPLSSEPLAFLLPGKQSEYEFKAAGVGKDRNRDVVIVEFATVNRRSHPVLIEDPGGHDDCFDWEGHIASRGRLWVDAETYDVVRVERGLRGPVDVRVPALLQRRYRFDTWVAIIRDDVSIRYKPVTFTDPEQVLLLPESIHTFTVLRGGLQSTRRHQRFSDYRRFVTGGRVLD